MGRYYHLSKKVSEVELKEIVKEMRELDDVKSVEITNDHDYMKVVTRDNEFSDVMGKAVNICSSVARGLELSFAKFAIDA